MNQRKSIVSSIYGPILVITAVTLACLVPFANRAFNIDDPLFIWVAQQIRQHPLDFYGFSINWYGSEMGAYQIIKNPPLAAYYAALIGPWFDWREIPLHLFFTLPALAAALGGYFLALEFTSNALLAALIGVLNPAFVLSGSTVMCDTLMVAFYVWAIYFWVRGSKADHAGYLGLAAFLVACSSLSKYFGISLIPLLAAYTLARNRHNVRHLAFLLIPVVLLGLYQWGTHELYGRGLLLDAAGYASREKGLHPADWLPNLVTGLSFTGGCYLTCLFFAPKLREGRALLVGACTVPLLAFAMGRLNFDLGGQQPGYGYFLQLSLFAMTGCALLLLALRDYRAHRDADALLLLLWTLGTFLFATAVNWTVNGRSLLPLAPVVGLLVARALDMREPTQRSLASLALPLAASWALCLLVAWGDYALADSARTAAASVAARSGKNFRPLWFQGHWGFQYYLQKAGGRSFDRKRSQLQTGDLMVIPENNTNISQDIYDRGTTLEVLRLVPASPIGIMNFAAGAGYYSSDFGPLPFRLGGDFEERYHLLTFRQPISPK
jgi:4-amino-4-deoxy-L-arabinose transferase-like glycosyltransferase